MESVVNEIDQKKTHFKKVSHLSFRQKWLGAISENDGGKGN